MLLRIAVFMTAVIFLASAAVAERIEMAKVPGDVQVTVEESNDTRIVISYKVGAFFREPLQIDNGAFYTLTLGEENVPLNAGEPALPQICRSVVIPDDAEMRVNVVSFDYVDFPNTPVAPSKGSILRTVNPNDVPYTFGPVYATDAWFPKDVAALRAPFILRDYRGMVVEFNPFQYNPVTRTLRVYTSASVEIVKAGPGQINVIRDRKELRLVPEFDRMYRERFINYTATLDKYTPVQEAGDMLVITYDSFRDSVMQLVNWKRQKGIKTTVVNVSTVGNTVPQIKSFIQAFYDTTNLAYILLVGDEGQVARPDSSGGAADPTYAKLAGSDNYPDAFIGRFSATTVGHTATQSRRSVDYEKNPIRVYWAEKGVGIASNLGPGHYNEYDSTHMNYIRNDLLGFTYGQVDKIYDPYATAAQVTTALNNGRSIINYCGHGSTTSWGTTGFSNTDVNNLSNQNMLPFIFSVACFNGYFDDGNTCFGEAWLRATNGSNPIGAVAAYMSSVSQYWDEPMEAQDEAADLLVSGAMTTFGGICFNGSCRMMDVYGYYGVQMFNTWIIFGDPSVQVRTDYPYSMTVIHDSYIQPGQATFIVQVTGIEGALCALYNNGTLYGSAYTDEFGYAVIPISGTLTPGQSMTLTATAFNRDPYINSLDVGYLPPAPTLVSPYNGQYWYGGRQVTLDWQDVSGADFYEVLLDNNIDFSSPIANPNNLTVSTYTTPYLGVSYYYWKVRVKNDIGWGPWSVVWSFQIRSTNPGCPVLFTYNGDSYREENPLLTACEKSGYKNVVTDYYHIKKPVAVDDGRVSFQLKESVDEITYLDDLQLITVEHSPDVRIACAVDGSIMAYSDIVAPTSAVDDQGNDQLAALAEEDGYFFSSAAPGHLIVTFPVYYGDLLGFTFGALQKPPYEIEEEPSFPPKVLPGAHAGTELTLEIQDVEGFWHEIATSVPSRENPVLEAVFSNVNCALNPDVITLRISWNGSYATDALFQYIQADETPMVERREVGDYSLLKADPGIDEWNGFGQGNPLVLRKGDCFDFSFEVGESQNPGMVRDYIIRAVGRYQPDDPAFGMTPRQFQLYNNYPNPFNPATTISYDLPISAPVKVDVLNILGQHVRTLVDETQSAGHYEVVWDSKDNQGRTVTSGVYIYRITTGDFTNSKKMVLLK